LADFPPLDGFDRTDRTDVEILRQKVEDGWGDKGWQGGAESHVINAEEQQ